MTGACEQRPTVKFRNWGTILVAASLCFPGTEAVALVIPAGVAGSGPGGFAGWTVTSNPSDNNGNVVTLQSFSGVAGNVMTFDTTFNNFNPITIHFTENPVLREVPSPIPGQPPIIVSDGPPSSTPCPPCTGGLNIVLAENIQNATTFPWTQFRWRLVDNAVVDPNSVPQGGADAAHPVFPHFHPATMVPMFPPFGVSTAFDAKTVIDLTNGPFPTGAPPFAWTGVRVHDREVQDLLRSFDLIQQPILDRGVSVRRQLSLTQLLGIGTYSAELTESGGESFLLSIPGLTWDNPVEFRLFSNEEAPVGGTDPSERILFFNQDMAARVVFLSDNEEGVLPAFPQGVTDPGLIPRDIFDFTGKEPPFNLTLSGNNGNLSLVATMASDPSFPAGTAPDASDDFMLQVVQVVPEPSALMLLAIGISGLLGHILRRERQQQRMAVARYLATDAVPENCSIEDSTELCAPVIV